MAENTELKELRVQMTSLRSATSVHTVLEEVAELKRSMAENTELKELRSQIATLNNSVKGKTLKITPDILGLPVKPVCRNCNKNAGGPNDHACYMEIAWSTTYSFPVTRKMVSDENGILRDTDRGGPRELTQKPISILLAPGDKVIVYSATFTCKKQFIHNAVCPFNKTPSWYENDVKNFVQEAFDKLCPEVSQQLETNSSVNKQKNEDDSKISQLRGQIDNINDFLGKQRLWIMEKFRACSTGSLNHSTVETHLKDYPGLRIAVSTFSSLIQQNKYFRLVNKQSSRMLNMDSSCKSKDDLERGDKCSPDMVSWTLEPVE
jgi:hypothetical protein